VVVVAAFPLRATGTDANVQVRGVSQKALQVRDNVKVVSGQFFQPGRNQLVVGRNVAATYAGFNLGQTVKFGGGSWTVVGVFDAGGSAFDSEIWCDANVLDAVYKRPQNVFQSVTARLSSPAAFTAFKDALTSDPRVTLQAERELDYYEKQSRAITRLIVVLGTMVAVVMGVGAVFGALNTMYSAVAERSRAGSRVRCGQRGYVLCLRSPLHCFCRRRAGVHLCAAA
jgi:putative ABC transport system permease protein